MYPLPSPNLYQNIVLDIAHLHSQDIAAFIE